MSRERLVEVFVQVADTLSDDFHVHDFVQTLAERCVELVDVDAAGVLLADGDGALQSIASTSESVHALGELQLTSGQGPWFDCYRSGRPLPNVDVCADRVTWAEFSEAARSLQYTRAHILPLRWQEHVIGVVALLGTGHGELSAEQLAVAQGLADLATIGLAHERQVRHLSVLSEQLQAALDSRILIEQAKGVLAERARVTVDDAFTLMRSYARRCGRPLRVVACGIVSGTISEIELSA